MPYKKIFTFIISILFFSCSSLPRRELTVEDLKRSALVENQSEQSNLAEMVETLAQRVLTKNDGHLDLLFLSGGGQHGAYGIGFLQGWKKNELNPMPQFDLVTGISTGALQAPFALVGTQESLDEASELYLNAAIDFAPTLDSFFWLRQTGGILDTERYEQKIKDKFSGKIIENLQSAFSENRQLAVGTANFDLGTGKTWNIKTELSNKNSGLERVHNVLFAATAIPGVFPAQIIDGFLQSDGGVVSNIMPIFNLESYRQLRERLNELGFEKPLEIHLWVILNFWTHPRLDPVPAFDRKKISERSQRLLFTLAQSQALERLHEMSSAVSSGVIGAEMHLKFTAIPSYLANEPGAQELFNKEWMMMLRSLGQERASGQIIWDEAVSPFERP